MKQLAFAICIKYLLDKNESKLRECSWDTWNIGFESWVVQKETFGNQAFSVCSLRKKIPFKSIQLHFPGYEL